MRNALEINNAFFGAWSLGTAAIYESLQTYLAPEVVWENIGLANVSGLEEVVKLFKQFEAALGFTRIEVEWCNVAVTGNKVLGERIDHLYAKDTKVLTGRAMGIIEVVDEKIVAWRDYFDTASFPK